MCEETVSIATGNFYFLFLWSILHPSRVIWTIEMCNMDLFRNGLIILEIT